MSGFSALSRPSNEGHDSIELGDLDEHEEHEEEDLEHALQLSELRINPDHLAHQPNTSQHQQQQQHEEEEESLEDHL